MSRLNLERLPDNALPIIAGYFSWVTTAQIRHLAMALPCGHHAVLPVEGPHAWAWDGNEDAPTLTPSILCRTGQCDWHGYMTAGEMRKC